MSDTADPEIVQDAKKKFKGQQGDRRPPGQQGDRRPPGQQGDRRQSGQQGDRRPPGQQGDRRPPGQQGPQRQGQERNGLRRGAQLATQAGEPTGTSEVIPAAAEEAPTNTPTPTPTPTTTTETAVATTAPEEEVTTEPLGLRLRRNYNQELRQKIDESTAVPKPNITQMLNILGDTYNLTPTEDGINIKGGPKSLVTFVTNYGINPDYKIDVPMTIKAFYNVFDTDGKPKESFDALMRKPAYHFICNHMLYRMVTLKMEIQLQNRSSLRRGELEAMYDKFDEFLKNGKCGFISKAAAQEAFEREEHNLLVPTGGGGAMVTKGLEDKLNYIIAILNKFIEDGMRERLKQLQANGFDCGIMEDTLKTFMDTTDMDMDTMIQKYLDVGVPSGGLKVCLGQMKMQAQETGDIGILIELFRGMKSGTELTPEQLNKLVIILKRAGLEVSKKGEYESLNEQLRALLELVQKGQTCTSCASDVSEKEVPSQAAIAEAAAAAAPAVPEPSPSTSTSTSPRYSVPVTDPSIIGTKSISPQSEESAADNPTVIPMPLINSYVSSLWIEGEKKLTMNQDIFRRMKQIDLNNTDIFFLKEGLGFKLLAPAKNFNYPKGASIVELDPVEIQINTRDQIRLSIVPQLFDGKVYRFTIKPKGVDASSVTQTAIEGEKSPEVDSGQTSLPKIQITSDSVKDKEASPAGKGSPAPQPQEVQEDDYKVYGRDGNIITVKNKKNEDVSLLVRPEFVKEELEVKKDITGLDDPVLIHKKTGLPFLVKISEREGFITKNGEGRYTWIAKASTTSSPETSPYKDFSPKPSPPVTPSSGSTNPSVAPSSGSTNPSATPAEPIVAAVQPPVTGNEGILLSEKTITPETEASPPSEQKFKQEFNTRILDFIRAEAKKETAASNEQKPFTIMKEYFDIDPKTSEKTIINDKDRVKLYNILQNRFKITPKVLEMMPTDTFKYHDHIQNIQNIFKTTLGNRIGEAKNFGQILDELVDSVDPTKKSVIQETVTAIKGKPDLENALLTEGIVDDFDIKGDKEDEIREVLRQNYAYLAGYLQTGWFVPTSIWEKIKNPKTLLYAGFAALGSISYIWSKKQGGGSANRIRYTRKRRSAPINTPTRTRRN